MKILAILLSLLPVFSAPDEPKEPELVVELYGQTDIGRVQLGFFDDGTTAGRMWPRHERPEVEYNWGTYHFLSLPNHGKGLLVITESYYMWGVIENGHYVGFWSCGNGNIGWFNLAGC